MRKLLLLFFLLFFAPYTFAQTLTYGVKAGINIARQAYTNLPSDPGNQSIIGPSLGVIIDIGFTNFSIQPGLSFTTKGGQSQVYLGSAQGSPQIAIFNKITLTYLELPVNFLYKAKFAGNSSLHIGGGPYFATAYQLNLLPTAKKFRDLLPTRVICFTTRTPIMALTFWQVFYLAVSTC